MRRVLSVVTVVLLSAPAFLSGPSAATAVGCAPAEEKPVDAESWAQRRMAVQRVWPLTEGAQRIAVVDTGVSATTPQLADAVLPGSDLGTGPGNGDCSGHGTFLAGLLAARPHDGSPFAGMAPAAQVLPIRVTDDPAEVDSGRLAKGIKAAVDGGARVIAVGLVTPADDPAVRAEVANAIARDVVVVASTAVQKDGEKAYPAALPGVLAVGGLGPDGPSAGPSGADAVLSAPSQDLVSIAPSGAGQRRGSAPELAVALAAGAAALVRDYHRDLTAVQVVARLVATADKLVAADARTGRGVVDPVAAVTNVLTGTEAVARPRPEHLVVPTPPRRDPGPLRRVLWFCAVLVVGAALFGAAAGLRALGRK